MSLLDRLFGVTEFLRNGTPLKQRNRINFKGSGFSAVDNPEDGTTDIIFDDAASFPEWEDGDYAAGAAVLHGGSAWVAPNGASEGQEPGVHEAWEAFGGGAGLITLPAPDITPAAALTALLGLSNSACFLDADWDGGIDAREVGANVYAQSIVDRVGGHEFTYALPSYLPKWGATLTPTGRRCLTFSGQQVLLSVGSALAEALDGSQPYSLYVVKKAASSSVSRTLVSIGNTGSAHRIDHYENSNLVRYLRNDGSGTTNSGGSAGGTWTIMQYVYDASDIAVWAGETQRITPPTGSANTRAPTCDRVSLGALFTNGGLSQFFDGEIAAVLAVLGAHDNSTRQGVVSNLNALYLGA